MSQCSGQTETPDGDESTAQLQQLLNDALQLADTLGTPMEIGARLQEVIDMVEDYLGDGGAGSS